MERISQLQQQIAELEKQAEQYKGNIAGEQAKAKSLQSEISTLNNQISKIQTQITITSKNIDKTGIEIEGLDKNIFDKQQSINYKKDTIGRVILELYKQDNENLLLVLLKNLNISDFFVKTQAAASLNSSLLSLVDELKEDRGELEVEKSD
jgi:septal ring factor EnvC (AmiA/AmiB activator)